jgi:hypothetical protein
LCPHGIERERESCVLSLQCFPASAAPLLSPIALAPCHRPCCPVPIWPHIPRHLQMIRQDGSGSRMKKRDACDKCHEMKSRCHKPPGSSSCIRCEKSAWHCHFSEALRSGRPKVHPALHRYTLIQTLTDLLEASHRSRPTGIPVIGAWGFEGF